MINSDLQNNQFGLRNASGSGSGSGSGSDLSSGFTSVFGFYFLSLDFTPAFQHPSTVEASSAVLYHSFALPPFSKEAVNQFVTHFHRAGRV